MLKRYIAKSAFYKLQRYISALIAPYVIARQRLLNRNDARILMYHSISNFPPEKDVPYDNVPPALFERQMCRLSEGNFNVVRLSNLIDIIEKGENIPPKTIVITFDDGYKNNFLNALPVLKKLKLTGTFFLIADRIGKNEPFPHLLWDNPSREFFSQFPESRLPISWDEARKLKSHNMEIGSHGLSHQSIGHMELKQAKLEIFDSKRILEHELSASVHTFSYPFGSMTYSDYTATTNNLLFDAGYIGACTTEIGPVINGSNLYELKRIPIRENDTLPIFEQKLMGAYDWVNISKRFFQRTVTRIDQVY
jgi:peptidoglycan/xylan/chitin deacetylase (PgdA/CDA1 family)